MHILTQWEKSNLTMSYWSYLCIIFDYFNSFMTRLLSYRNQSTDLLRKSMDWFLYENGLRHERVNYLRLKIILTGISFTRETFLGSHFSKFFNVSSIVVHNETKII